MADINTRYVRIKKFVEMTGYTDKAIRHKIADGVWREGVEFRRPPDGNIVIDLENYQRWVEGRG